MYCEKLSNGKVRYIQTYKDYISGASRKVYAVFDKDTSRNRMLAAQRWIQFQNVSDTLTAISRKKYICILQRNANQRILSRLRR